jgi:hypothetical protein
MALPPNATTIGPSVGIMEISVFSCQSYSLGRQFKLAADN